MGMSVGSPGDEEELVTAINVAPLVDVCLVLVIIFMVATPFMTQSRLTVTLPKATTGETRNEDHVTITIDKKGDISVNEKDIYTPAELERELLIRLRGTRDQVVIIRADNEIDHGTVIDAMETAKKVNPKRIYFATIQKETD
ncbi:MAG TPA: biopolymer transporter ExbD [bacterium]|nr:biopolymer transporter ExbD [bacterium]